MPAQPGGRRRGGLLRALVVLGALLLLGACTHVGPPSRPAAGGKAPARVTPSTPASPDATPSSHTTWHVVALGDSVTTGGPCGCTAFPALYARDLAAVRGVRVTAQNLGQNGQDSTGLLGQLGGSGTVSDAVRGADIVLLTIGANDFADQHGSVTTGECLGGASGACIRGDLATMRRNVAQIVTRIHRLRGGRPTTVLVTGYWNVFEDGAVARDSFPDVGVRATRQLTRLANEAIRQDARTTGGTYVDLYAPFNGPMSRGDTTRLLASDGDHPNAAGQALIAERLVAAGLPGLAEG